MQANQFFKCLTDETRLKCLLLIAQEGELCVCELIAAVHESQPKISRHLAQLRKCQLLSDRRQGQWVFYRLHSALPKWQRDILMQTLAANQQELNASLHSLDAMTGRPIRGACC
ncbi:MAG: metalloregulator ArsR/SmtB family transcription factor [Idiomarina sp.]